MLAREKELAKIVKNLESNFSSIKMRLFCSLTIIDMWFTMKKRLVLQGTILMLEKTYGL